MNKIETARQMTISNDCIRESCWISNLGFNEVCPIYDVAQNRCRANDYSVEKYATAAREWLKEHNKKTKLTLTVELEIVESLPNDAVATIYYPNEGNKIKIIKGLNTIEFSEAIHHEIGHLFDWYLSNGNQSSNQTIKENIADEIGNSIRYKE